MPVLVLICFKVRILTLSDNKVSVKLYVFLNPETVYLLEVCTAGMRIHVSSSRDNFINVTFLLQLLLLTLLLLSAQPYSERW